jgi:hypothetical protein
MMRKIFGRKKDEKKEDTDGKEGKASSEDSVSTEDTNVPAAQVAAPAAPEEVEATAETTLSTEGSVTIPYHATFQDRLKYMLTEDPLASSIEAPDEFKLELMAMGERFTVVKKSMGEVELSTGAAPDEDVFIRVSNDAVSELLSAANFTDFSKLYLKYYKNAEAGKFVKIELRKSITELNRRGYARVPALKLLIGAARA